jgi:PAS domain S-box-containing protein
LQDERKYPVNGRVLLFLVKLQTENILQYMNVPDMHTVILSYVITNLVSTIVILFLWIQNHKHYAGITLWLIDFILQTIALILIISRGYLPDLVSMVVSNAMVIGGAILGLIGLGRFVGIKIRNVHNYILLAIFIVIHFWFTSVSPSLAFRSLNTSVALLILFSQYTWVAFKKVSPKIRKQTWGVGVVFIGFSVISVFRIVQFFHNRNTASDYFNSGEFEAVVMIIYQMLFILLTYSLVLMFNKRLYVDLALQEEKFSKAFHNSINSVTLTRLSDGKIIEANSGFLNITGYKSSEIVGKTILDLHFWDNEEEREFMVEEVLKTGKMDEKELKFRRKNGEIITGLLSAGIIEFNDENFVLINIKDISERKLIEKFNVERIEELEKFNKIMVGREKRMVELKQEVNELCANMKIPPKYKSPAEVNNTKNGVSGDWRPATQIT